jgi:hypothetical protein
MKKGVSQIDWIISLAIFLLYIVWFFVFITPQINSSYNVDSSLDFLKSFFYEEFKWSLTKTPIFIESNYSGFLPVIINNTFGSDSLMISEDLDYVAWKNKVIFLADIPYEKKTYWVLSGGGYVHNYSYQGIDAENNRVSIENMSINFRNSLLRSAAYINKERIKDASFWINNDAALTSGYSFQDYGFGAFYNSEIGNLNHTSFIFNKNTEIYNLISTGSSSTYRLKILLELDDYNNYYSDNLNFGSFDYSNISKSISYSHDKLTLYGQDYLTIFFDSEATFSFSYYNSSLKAEIEFDVWDDYIYRIVFHKEGYDLQKDKVNAKTGVSTEIEGINLESISTNYEFLKNKWGFENFYILVYENSSERISSHSFEIGNYNPETRNVYANTENLNSLENDGTYKPISVNYRIW